MHPRVRRFVAAVFAPWFAVVTVQPAVSHQCAMHSAHHVAAAAHASAPATHTMPDGRVMPATHRMPDGRLMASRQISDAAPTAPVPAPSRGHDTGCTCDDGCCVAGAAAAPPSTVELAFAPAAVRRAAPLLGTTGVAPLATPHVLPFANGPPARV